MPLNFSKLYSTLLSEFKIFHLFGNWKVLLVTLVGVIANSLIGHYFPPASIMITPIVLIIITVLISFTTIDFKPIWKSIWILIFVILNDLGIKFYAGGTLDLEGLGLITLMLLIGLIPSYTILVITSLNDKVVTKHHKRIAIFIFPIVLIIYLYLSINIGLVEY